MPKLVHKVIAVRYQRNGVDGDGFFHVFFTMREGRHFRPMLGILVPTDEGFIVARTAVVALDNPREAWRGPDFAPELASAVVAAGDSAFGNAHPTKTDS